MGPRLKMGLLTGTFALLALAAVTGWVRKPTPASAAMSYGNNPEPVASVATAITGAPSAAPATTAYNNSSYNNSNDQQVSYDAYGTPIHGSATYNSATNSCVQESAYAPPPPYASPPGMFARCV